MKRIELKESEYIVMPAKILEARMMTAQEKYFKITLRVNRQDLNLKTRGLDTNL